MKKQVLLIVFVLFGITLKAQGYRVKDYSATIYLSEKGYFDVVEIYDVEFKVPSHGIFREIVTQFDYEKPNGEIEERRLYLSKIKTPGEKHKTNPALSAQNFSKQLQIRIGDADRYVENHKRYEIRYRVQNALFQNDSIVQLYWNVKPSNWEAPFENIRFKIHAPEGTTITPENSFVYAGRGDTEVSKDFTYSYNDREFAAESINDFESKAGESVTVLINLPESAFTQVGYSPSFLKQYGWVGIVLFPLLLFWRQRNKYGKNNKVIAVTSYYPPKGVDSAMAGYLINNKADATDLISLIPKWGHEGLIGIREIPKKGWFGKEDMAITKLNDLPDNAPAYERTIFQGLFSGTWQTAAKDVMNMIKNAVKSHSMEEFSAQQNHDSAEKAQRETTVLVSSLKNNFYQIMDRGKNQLKIAAKLYYDQDVAKKSRRLMLWALLWLVGGSVLLWFSFGLIPTIANGIVCFLIFFILSKMDKRTSEGDAVLGELKGFKNFVKIAETNRIKMLIQEDPDYFEKTMSYALTFGLLKQWAGKFEALDIQPPEWYTGRSGMSAVGVSSFANHFSNQMSAMQTTMVSSPKSSSSSSGGGSAGGGAGSGGGGRW